MSNNNAKTHSWPYDPRHWERPAMYPIRWYDADRPDWLKFPRAPRLDAAKESPGKDGTGEFGEDGLQLA